MFAAKGGGGTVSARVQAARRAKQKLQASVREAIRRLVRPGFGGAQRLQHPSSSTPHVLDEAVLQDTPVSGRVLATLKKDTPLQIVGEDEDGWLNVQYGVLNGWVRKEAVGE